MNGAAAMESYPIGEFISVFTGNETFLSDHIIQDRKILPGTAYLELARAAIALSVEVVEKNIIVLKECIFIQPIIVSDELSVTVKIYPGANGEFGVEVSTELGIHFQSKVLIQSRYEDALLPSGEIVDVASLEKQCQLQGPDKQEFYKNFKSKGINLGASHRGISSIKLGDNCAFIRAHLPGSSARGMDLDPGMLDCFIQSAAVLARNLEEGVRLPFAIQSMKIFGKLTDNMCAFLTKKGEAVDYVIADEDGYIKVIITGFVGRELESQDQLVYYKPILQEESAINLSSDHLVIVEGQPTFNSLVKAVFEAARKIIDSKVNSALLDVRLPETKPAWRGIIALLKTIALEYPKIAYRLKFGNSYIDTRYHFVNIMDAPVYSWPNNKTVLITGGLGGLGKLFALDIAQASKHCRLILTGRTELNDKKKAFIKSLEELGAHVIYIQCDVCNRDEVDNLIKNYPQINGVIHASGVIKDNFINKKSIQEIDLVLAPKVQGLENIDEATARTKLDYFITLSSIAGALGNAGQADYAAANAYMDAYILHRAEQVKNQQRSGKSISINWPLWESEGMQIDEATRKNLYQVFKVKPMPAAQGLLALRQIMASDLPQLIVLYGNRKAIDAMFQKPVAPTGKESASGKGKMRVEESNKLIKAVLQEVRTITADHIKRKSNQMDDTSDWAEFGFDSILLASLVNRFNSQFNLSLMPTIFFEATNMQLFSQYLIEKHMDRMLTHLSSLTGEKSEQDIAPDVSTEPKANVDVSNVSIFAQSLKRNYRDAVTYREKDIAIIGISCRIAGARNLHDFWKMLEDEKDMITEIPQERWDWRDYPESSKWGSFIDGVSEFDSLFFGISPVEAAYINPEQRLIMQYVWECIENAGCGGNITRGSSTGVFIGCGPSSYTELLSCMPVEAYTATGEVPSVGPNRISYFMDWHGPSNPVETACSSALVAVHRAVEAIRAGHCEQAVAGGINLLLTPHAYISFSKAGMLAEDGRCKTFSDKADGYTRGEGVGMIMLKPLKQAVRDGNIIYAVVKGTAENHGGRTNSLTAPNPKSQSAVIKAAIRDAEIDFSRVSYVECHGTGTGLGDPVEINGLKTVASDLLTEKYNNHYCKLGSIKSNIGHLEFAAGIAGIIKVVLQMQHKKIARSLHCEKINPYIDLSGTHFAIAQQACEWTVPPGKTRIAGVSSFGFGGVNAHIILEEYQDSSSLLQQKEFDSSEDNKPRLLIFSARNELALVECITQFPEIIETLRKDGTSLKNVAYTLQTGRAEMQERLVFVTTSLDDWAFQIDDFLNGRYKNHEKGVFKGTVKTNTNINLELGETESGRNYIKQLIEDNEMEKIAELWVSGAKIDWSIFYE